MKVIILFIFFCTASSIFSQEIRIQDIAGIVEIRSPGSQNWVPAQRGQSISGDTVISTGFRSTAMIQAGSSVLTVRPLTRLTVSELLLTTGIESINVNLQTGRVRVDVNPPAGTRANLNITGPTSVASVRGTSFEFDTSSLYVLHGTIEYTGRVGTPLMIDAGRNSFVHTQNYQAVLPFDTSEASFKPAPPITSWAVNAEESVNASDFANAESDNYFEIHLPLNFPTP